MFGPSKNNNNRKVMNTTTTAQEIRNTKHFHVAVSLKRRMTENNQYIAEVKATMNASTVIILSGSACGLLMHDLLELITSASLHNCKFGVNATADGRLTVMIYPVRNEVMTLEAATSNETITA